MKTYIFAAAALTVALLLSAAPNIAQGQKEAKAEPKCPVSGKAIDKDHAVQHNGGTVWFCCPRCPPAFKANTAKFSAKANHQLLVTTQAKQVKCPFTGKDLDTDTKIIVAGTNVCFCCAICQGKAEKLKGDKQINAIFNDKAFKKGFEVKAAK